MIIGSHVEYKKESGLLGSVNKALSYGANTFMFYVGAPQNTKRCEVDKELTIKAHDLMKENNIDINNVIVHAPYIINMANENNLDFNISFLNAEIKRCKLLGINKMVIHPGSHIGKGINEGIKNIVKVLDNIDDMCILLETMAGKGSEVGSNFDELKEIMDMSTNKNLGICMDTCHLNDSGYDVSCFDEILKEFDKKIGLKYLKCVHINDSKNEVGSHKDRHENIGYGCIGFDNMINIIYNDKLKDIPLILETPYILDNPPYKEEIENIKSKVFKSFK